MERGWFRIPPASENPAVPAAIQPLQGSRHFQKASQEDDPKHRSYFFPIKGEKDDRAERDSREDWTSPQKRKQV